MIPFLGYAPDLDPTLPGVMTNCAAIIPTIRGFKGAPSAVQSGYAALAAQCYGAAQLRKADDTGRLFAGTAAGLYEGSGSSWTDRTAGGGYTLGSTNFWRFAQLGDVSLAAAKSEKLQSITTASTFAAATTTAPKASIVETANNFVLLFDVNDQGAIYDSADRPDGWWCGPKGDYVDFTPSVTTEAATGRLMSTPGKILAGRRFGYQVVAYKQRSMYLGTYVGQPTIWDWQLIPGEAGALSQEVVVNVGTPEDPKHIFMGADNFYSFSGGRPIPIGNPIKDTVFSELNTQYSFSCKALHDTKAKVVRFYYPVNSSNMPEKCVVYNYVTDKWGRDDRQIEACVEFQSGGLTYNSLGSSYATYDSLPDLAYDLAFASSGLAVPAIFDTLHVLRTLSGPSSSSSITLGDYGDPQMFATLQRVIPKFLTAPDSANFVHFYRDVISDNLTQGVTVALSSGRFDVLKSARWHRGRMDMVGNHELPGIDAALVQDGEE